jgi:hypothetical protein
MNSRARYEHDFGDDFGTIGAPTGANSILLQHEAVYSPACGMPKTDANARAQAAWPVRDATGV